ncbi:unnamed protein product [Clonostachys rhizophaga]|uniref:Uncharacterized protein n=1 Tax=Clonostachys rhizophaga TaxID=160324 RepID=A0A9N9W091_9HYPO|nr:unnamed protein product [Clonostachys rhizophaga]
MPLCNRCRTLTIDEIVDNDVLFHSDICALKSSAERGCEFCVLCWTTIQTASRTQLDKLLSGKSAWPEGQEWTPTMWLRGGHFFEAGSAGVYILVSCGKATWTSATDSDMNGSPSVTSRLEVYQYGFGPSSFPRYLGAHPNIASAGDDALRIKIQTCIFQ